MTKANLNFVWQQDGTHPRCPHYYWNGDQYPAGLRDFYGVGEWLRQADAFNPEGFKTWVKTAYRKASAHDRKKYADADFVPRSISHPCIYYDEAGFPTDYSYIFEAGLIPRD